MNWAEKPQVRKGTLGENLVDDFLRGKKVIPYKPDYDGAHVFDRLCATADKKTIFVADIKAKAHRTYYRDTGINLSHYHDYKNIAKKYGLRVFVFFVDEHLCEIYGNWIDKLERPLATRSLSGRFVSYPLIQARIIYFPLENMVPIAHVDYERAKALIALSTRNHGYELR